MVTVIKRSYHSMGWLPTAEIMRALAVEAGGGVARPESMPQLRAFVLSAVTGSVAFLEAHINELFDDALEYLSEPNSPALRGLEPETQIRMAALWPYMKKYRIMEKYGVALDVSQADPPDSGAEPQQSAHDLLAVRNHYVHYQPYSVRDGVAAGKDRALSERMRGRLTLPAWDTSSESLFPTRAICPDLARWAVQSAVRFTDEFCARLGVIPGYNHVRPDWLT